LISVRIEDKGVNDLFKTPFGAASGPAEDHGRIAGDMKDAVEQNFQEEGRPPWPKSKKKSGKTLWFSGKLAKVSASSNNDSAIVSTNLPYAAAQHFGINRIVNVRAFTRRVKSRDSYARGKRGGKGKRISSGISSVKAHSMHMRLPPRPYLQLTDGDIENIKQELLDFLLKQ